MSPQKFCTASWTPLSGATGTIELVDLSVCDDCGQEIDLGFEFMWLGGTSTISKVYVSTNGHILINPGDNDKTYDLHAIGDNNKPRIAVAQEDLDLRSSDSVTGGHLYIQKSASSIIISYEQVRFFPRVGSGINAQAHIFANGRVNICFGSGSIPPTTSDIPNKIASGLEGGENDLVYGGSEGAIAAPLPGIPFDSDGLALVWPTANSCYCFSPSSKTWFI